MESFGQTGQVASKLGTCGGAEPHDAPGRDDDSVVFGHLLIPGDGVVERDARREQELDPMVRDADRIAARQSLGARQVRVHLGTGQEAVHDQRGYVAGYRVEFLAIRPALGTQQHPDVGQRPTALPRPNLAALIRRSLQMQVVGEHSQVGLVGQPERRLQGCRDQCGVSNSTQDWQIQ
jgi:hypothetical protein